MAQGGTAPTAARQADAGSLTPGPERVKADRSTARIIMRGGLPEGGTRRREPTGEWGGCLRGRTRRRIRVDFKPE